MQKQFREIEKLLKEAGFLDKEISVYLSILELGKGIVSEISRRAGVNRTTGYVILDSLVSKGLITISGKKPKQEYAAEPPENLLIYLKDRAFEQVSLAKDFEELLPELSSVYNKGDRPKVRFYEGKQGLIDVYEDTLTSTEGIRAFATYEDMHKTLPDYFPDYYKRRAKKGIFGRGIVPATEMAKERRSKNKEEARDLAFVPQDKYLFSPEIDIYDNKVMIASWREKLGIIIESAEIADAMKKIFELAWAEALRLDDEMKK